MNETVLWSALVGFFTFLAGQLIVKLVVEPVAAFKKAIADVAAALQFRAPQISNPGVSEASVIQEASTDLRRFATNLTAHLMSVPYYSILRKPFSLPDPQKVEEARTQLIGLSNSLGRGDSNVYESNAKRVDKICDLLAIYRSKDDRWPAETGGAK